MSRYERRQQNKKNSGGILNAIREGIARGLSSAIAKWGGIKILENFNDWIN